MGVVNKPTVEDLTTEVTASGVAADGPVEVSALTLVGGSADSTAILYNNEAASGDVGWALAAKAGESSSVSFPKPIPFDIGIYATLAGSGAKLYIARTNS